MATSRWTPRRYTPKLPVVERIVASTARPIKALIGDGSFLRGLKAEPVHRTTPLASRPCATS